jgi:hypothetical protein
VTHTPTSPSGSRWEPVPTTDVGTGPAFDAGTDLPAAGQHPGEEPRRRRRSPVLVALVALLSMGATAGAAYEVSARRPDSATSPSVGRPSVDGGTDGDGQQPGRGPYGHGGGHRHGGPGALGGQDAPRTGESS